MGINQDGVYDDGCTRTKEISKAKGSPHKLCNEVWLLSFCFLQASQFFFSMKIKPQQVRHGSPAQTANSSLLDSPIRPCWEVATSSPGSQVQNAELPWKGNVDHKIGVLLLECRISERRDQCLLEGCVDESKTLVGKARNVWACHN